VPDGDEARLVVDLDDGVVGVADGLGAVALELAGSKWSGSRPPSRSRSRAGCFGSVVV